MRRTKKDLVAQLENPNNPSGRVDVLVHGVLSQLVNSQEERMGLPQGSALGVIKPHIAQFAHGINREVTRLGINPDLVGLGLLISVNLYKRFQQASQQGALPVPQSANGVDGANSFNETAPPPNNQGQGPSTPMAGDRMPPKGARVVGTVPVMGFGRQGRGGRIG